MNKIIFVFAFLCLIGSMYYFFYEKNLFLGSVTLILTIALNIIYAVTGSVNVIDQNEKK
jgi:uncharacterized membrane protein YfhO